MIPAAFEYKRAGSVDEAIAALAGGDCKLLAGGHSLVPAMKLRLNQPSKLVDIANIAALKGIKENKGEIVIGAAVTHHEIAVNDIIKNYLHFFSQGALLIGDLQVRNYGTIGGSLAHADPSSDWPAMVLAADGMIDVTSSGGSRSIKATDFFTGLFSTQLKEDEIITAIRIPIPPTGTKTVYLKFRHPASRFAVVGCAVLREPDGNTHIGFTGISEAPFRDSATEKTISAKALDEKTIDAAVNASLNDVTFLGDFFASQEYRKHLARVYLKRALQAVV